MTGRFYWKYGMILVFILILSFWDAPYVFCQNDVAHYNPEKSVTIQGVVVDKKNEPVIGAIIYDERDNVNSGTLTDIDGFFTIKIHEGETTLHIQCIGYHDAERIINTNKSSDKIVLIVMEEVFYINKRLKISLLLLVLLGLGAGIWFFAAKKGKGTPKNEHKKPSIDTRKRKNHTPTVRVVPSSSDAGLSPGYLLQGGKYLIDGTLGQGGFGITYAATQVALRRKVAIKEFFVKEYCERDSSTKRVKLVTAAGNKELVSRFRTKFIREAQMIASLEHPHIIKIYDVFEENGTAYYVMEYHDGGSLMDMVKQYGPLGIPQAIEYISQIGDALSYLHSQNLLHFDIKPSNILLNKAGKAILIDFGISKHYDESGSQTSSTPVGISKGYAPLEQYQQTEVTSFTPATDIYALSATLYTLLTGVIPPSASEVNEDGLPNMPDRIPKVIQAAIIKGMSPRRKQRPQTVKSFIGLLDGTIDPDEETMVFGVRT